MNLGGGTTHAGSTPKGPVPKHTLRYGHTHFFPSLRYSSRVVLSLSILLLSAGVRGRHDRGDGRGELQPRQPRWRQELRFPFLSISVCALVLAFCNPASRGWEGSPGEARGFCPPSLVVPVLQSREHPGGLKRINSSGRLPPPHTCTWSTAERLACGHSARVGVCPPGAFPPPRSGWCVFEWAQTLSQHGPDGFHMQLAPQDRQVRLRTPVHTRTAPVPSPTCARRRSRHFSQRVRPSLPHPCTDAVQHHSGGQGRVLQPRR